jgi:capsular exopolysaccharide synthesis family protein
MEPLAERLPAAGDGAPWERELSVADIVAAIRRRWWVVLAVTVLVLGLGVWRTLRQPLIFRAAATVRFQQMQAPVATPGVPTYRWDPRIDPLISEQQLIRSQNVADRVAQLLGLRLAIVAPRITRSQLFQGTSPGVDSALRSYQDFRLRLDDRTYTLSSGGVVYGTATYGDSLIGGGLRLLLPARPALKERSVLVTVLPASNAAGVVRGGLATRVLSQTDIFEISYQGPDPVLVRDIANTVAETYRVFSNELQRTQARAKTQFIESAIADQERRLIEAQDAVKRFKSAHETVDITSDQRALFEQIQKLDADRGGVLLEQRVYQSLIGKLAPADTVDEDLRKLVGTEAVGKNQAVANLYSRWFDLAKQREEELSQGKTPIHPDVRAIDRLISNTKVQLRIASEVYLQALRSRFETLAENIDELKQHSKGYPELANEQIRLEADARTAQAMYESLQSQLQAAKIQEISEGGGVRIIDPASVPELAISPKRRRAAMLALALGVFLGLGAAVLLERLDASVKTTDELRERFDLDVLALIPEIRLGDAGSSGPGLARLVTHVDPRSPVAEAYRSLRTNLAFARGTQDHRTVVFTSPGPADGKSTTVANLAITFAQQGQRTLLVDADLRRSVLDRSFDVPRSPGLTDVIAGRNSFDDAVHTTEVPNLFLLASGHSPPNPSELLGSAGMRAAVGAARERFDVVIFDSPPLLAVTDAAVLATQVDGVVLIVRMQKSQREAVRRAVGQLRQVGARVLGAVVNAVTQKQGRYYGGYGYYYYSYYGAESARNGRSRVLDRLRGLAGMRSGSNGSAGG